MAVYPAPDDALFFEGHRRMEAGDAEVLANLGLLRERTGAVEDAEPFYRRAIAIRPDEVQRYLNLEVLLMKCRRKAHTVSRRLAHQSQ